ncbi:hypothetical protein Enr13x_59330 [Stieleria neptunia]|uniref:Uncharacterized protein n=1 Tax=Stieleria neptunia TaxID=2527979 RepID=A0A518HYW2_9BACT|nr:hypothetical protein Enr13x_59330 [Stieleria neptunia]
MSEWVLDDKRSVQTPLRRRGPVEGTKHLRRIADQVIPRRVAPPQIQSPLQLASPSDRTEPSDIAVIHSTSFGVDWTVFYRSGRGRSSVVKQLLKSRPSLLSMVHPRGALKQGPGRNHGRSDRCQQEQELPGCWVSDRGVAVRQFPAISEAGHQQNARKNKPHDRERTDESCEGDGDAELHRDQHAKSGQQQRRPLGSCYGVGL